ncbi:hypothetical protein HDU96_001686, partial [Phlyctochytrium bullatum]
MNRVALGAFDEEGLSIDSDGIMDSASQFSDAHFTADATLEAEQPMPALPTIKIDEELVAVSRTNSPEEPSTETVAAIPDGFFVTNDIPRDGNCLFLAVSLLAYGKRPDEILKFHAGRLRRLSSEIIRNDIESFTGIYPGEELEVYLTKIVEDGEFGDFVSVVALALHLVRTIEVFIPKKGGFEKTIFRPHGDDAQYPARLFLHANVMGHPHYECIVPTRWISNASNATSESLHITGDEKLARALQAEEEEGQRKLLKSPDWQDVHTTRIDPTKTEKGKGRVTEKSIMLRNDAQGDAGSSAFPAEVSGIFTSTSRAQLELDEQMAQRLQAEAWSAGVEVQQGPQRTAERTKSVVIPKKPWNGRALVLDPNTPE